jgi:hypothetical protein
MLGDMLSTAERTENKVDTVVDRRAIERAESRMLSRDWHHLGPTAVHPWECLMFKIEWTAHEQKPQDQLDELFLDLQESIAMDGPTEFAVLLCAAELLETDYAVAHLHGFGDRATVLDYSDVVELFMGLDAALDALDGTRTGVIELYPGPGSDYIAFETASPEEVRLVLVPWPEAAAIDPHKPLPDNMREYPTAVSEREQVIDHLKGLRRSFAQAVLDRDPRFGEYEPIRRWSFPS